MTQAARKRSMVEKAGGFQKARGFQKGESADEGTQRIARKKQRMACNACRSHGKVVFGLWHSDPECPYYEESRKKKEKGAFLRSTTKTKLPKATQLLSWGRRAPKMREARATRRPSSFMSLWLESAGIGLSDTCCAKTVVGTVWMKDHVAQLQRREMPYHFMNEREPFRFGGGPKIDSSQATPIPVQVPGCSRWIAIKASVVVDQSGSLEGHGDGHGLGEQSDDF